MTKADNGLEKRIKTEAETLATFQEEIPSMYFSHLGEKEYKDYNTKAKKIYRDHFKFPSKMFDGADLIDFGAGTGENTVYLANWGAKCTLIEMNKLAQDVSKKVFSKFTNNPDDHNFVLSSIFDYEPETKKLYDIVHCRGVLSHTAAKEQAFEKISTYVKPGGYLIFGDPNKAGGFQNMLQRYAVYSYASTPDEMVDVSELLFKEDIDRSEKTIPRTRRAIIFDRWVIQSQDDPSVQEVVSWVEKSGLRMYSSFPPVLPQTMGDSLHHQPRFDPFSLHELFTVTELAWMTQTVSDADMLTPMSKNLRTVTSDFEKITGYVENLNASSKIDTDEFCDLSRNLRNSVGEIDPIKSLRDKLTVFMLEAENFVRVVKEGDLKNVRKFIEGTAHLFRGACGNRHVDFIAYKPDDADL
jgi:2-polyprenyl-3-methyl-5-hydroxy-6-metoxy-1,4-benzoquinol methylase